MAIEKKLHYKQRFEVCECQWVVSVPVSGTILYIYGIYFVKVICTGELLSLKDFNQA
jgi:hypothetical protein